MMTPTRRMHVDEVDTDAALVRRLLGAQFPQWAELSITPVASAGTDNALYRLGDDLMVRLPRIYWAIGQVETEYRWLPRLAPHLPLTIPVQLARGEPAAGYPWQWSVYRWLPGESAIQAEIADLKQVALDLAHFLRALQQIDPTDGPPAVDRGAPLALRDQETRAAIAALQGLIDTDGARAVWAAALAAPVWDRAPVWLHGDMLPGNLLIDQGRLRAVIDFNGLGVGDPAADLIIAWSLFSGASRDAFRAALQVDDATWVRGRGLALSVALIALPYYLETNPVIVSQSQRTITQVLAESRLSV